MRSLYPDSAYFGFLDSIRAECGGHPHLAADRLVAEFPALRAEEAKAVCCDWLRSRRSASVTVFMSDEALA